MCVNISEKRILWNVSGHAHSGAVLAVMGPSGEFQYPVAFGNQENVPLAIRVFELL